jgi:hypothetical protein
MFGPMQQPFPFAMTKPLIKGKKPIAFQSNAGTDVFTLEPIGT